MTAPAADASRPRVDVRAVAAAAMPRAVVLVAFPVLAALLFRSMGFYAELAAIPAPFLEDRLLSKPTLLVTGVVGGITVLALMHRTRSAQFLLGLAAAVVLWVGIYFSRLRWHRLLPDGGAFDTLRNTRQILDVQPSWWLYAALLLTVAAGYAIADNARATRVAYVSKGIREEDARAAGRAVARGSGVALMAGLGSASLLGLVYFGTQSGLGGLLGALPRLNPVVALLVGGVLTALVLASLLRGRDVATGEWRAPLAAAHPEAREGAPQATARSGEDAHVDQWIAHELRQGDRGRER